MLEFLHNWIRKRSLLRRRRLYREGETLSRFIAKDIRREIIVVSDAEVDEGFITARVRTSNILYLSKGLAEQEPFSGPERIPIDDLWTWAGNSWGGQWDGTSLADK